MHFFYVVLLFKGDIPCCELLMLVICPYNLDDTTPFTYIGRDKLIASQNDLSVTMTNKVNNATLGNSDATIRHRK